MSLNLPVEVNWINFR